MKKTIHSSGRAMIYLVFSRCLAKSQAGQVLSDIENVYQRTADMTGKSVNQIRQIVEDGKKIKSCGVVEHQVAAEQAFLKITAEDWKNSCKHVMEIEKEYYDRGVTVYEQIERSLINLSDDSTSSSDLSELEYASDYIV